MDVIPWEVWQETTVECVRVSITLTSPPPLHNTHNVITMNTQTSNYCVEDIEIRYHLTLNVSSKVTTNSKDAWRNPSLTAFISAFQHAPDGSRWRPRGKDCDFGAANRRIHWLANMDCNKQYNDGKGCLMRSLFTKFFSTLWHALGGSAKIIYDQFALTPLARAVKIAILALPINELAGKYGS